MDLYFTRVSHFGAKNDHTLFDICYHKESLYISHFHSCSAIRYAKLFMGVVNQANWIVFITF